MECVIANFTVFLFFRKGKPYFPPVDMKDLLHREWSETTMGRSPVTTVTIHPEGDRTTERENWKWRSHKGEVQERNLQRKRSSEKEWQEVY